MRVAVIGAGFAGLAAAEELARNGIDVVVFEARDRVGGRVWSRELADGTVIELGAEFVEPHDGVVAATAERLGLQLCNRGIAYGDREPRGGLGVERATLLAAIGRIGTAVLARSDERVSVAGLVAGLELDPGAAEVFLARIQVTAATEPEGIDATTLAGSGVTFSHELSCSVAGGNQRIAFELARSLGAAVRLGAPVDRVATVEGGAIVRAGGNEHEVDAVVCTVPASVLARIAFEPPLPEAQQAAVERVRYGHAAKLFVPLAVPAPCSAVLNVPERYWSWVANRPDGSIAPLVHSFAGSPSALTVLEVARGAESWLGSLAAFRPELALRADEVILATWDDDPWVGAAYTTIAPGRPAEDPALLRQPAGPIHFAGEHTAGIDYALMEGALASGLRAAGEVIDTVRAQAR